MCPWLGIFIGKSPSVVGNLSKSVEVLIKNSDILRSQLLGATTKTQNLATHKNKIIRWGIIGIFIKELVAALIIASILFLMGALYFGLSKIYDPVDRKSVV